MVQMDEQVLRFVELHNGRVDLAGRRVVCGEETVRLSTLEARLLRHLATTPGQPHSRDALLREVWGYASAKSFRAVDVAMHRLRKKLFEDPSDPRHLLTVQGAGYVFIPARSEAAADKGNGAARQAAEERPSKASPAQQPPRFRGSLIGRDAELQELVEKLDRDVPALLLTGPPGVGKSRLADEAVRRLPPRELLWVDLAGVEDRGALLQALAQVQGAESSAAPTAEARTQLIARRMAARGLQLLVLDNVERLGDELEAVVAELRDHAPRLGLLLTSRRPIKLEGFVRSSLAPLDLLNARRLLLARIEQAAAGTPAEDDPRLTGLVEGLDRLPLAIELAAARLRYMSLDDLAKRLDQRLQWLHKPGRQGEALSDAIAWAVSQLDDDERAVLRQACIFEGNFDLAAAEAVLQAADGLWLPDLLETLLDSSLLEHQRDDEDGRAIYRLLRTVREYVASLPPTADQDGLAERHALHFAAIADQLDIDPEGEIRIDTLHRLDKLGSDLVRAWRWCVKHRPDRLSALTVAVDGWWITRGNTGDRLALISDNLAALGPDTAAQRSRLLLPQARALSELVRPHEALAALEETVELLTDKPPSKLSAVAWLELSFLYEELARSDDFLHATDTAWQHAADSGDPAIAAHLDAVRCAAYRMLGRPPYDPRGFSGVLADAVDTLIGCGEMSRAVYAMIAQIRLRFDEGDSDAARSILERAERLAVLEDLPFQRSHLEAQRAVDFQRRLRFNDALDAWQRCVDLLRSVGYTVYAAIVQARRAFCLIHLQRFDEARRQVLAASQSYGSETGALAQLTFGQNLGWVAIEEHDLLAARRYIVPALEASAELMRDRIPALRALLALVELLEGKEEQALALLADTDAEPPELPNGLAGLIHGLVSIVIGRRLERPTLVENGLAVVERQVGKVLEPGPAAALLERCRRAADPQSVTGTHFDPQSVTGTHFDPQSVTGTHFESPANAFERLLRFA